MDNRLVLDIGAGSKEFARRLRRRNRNWRFHCLAGEPHWRRQWNGHIKPGRIERIQAKYASFGLPDHCLHMVTVNAYFPMGGGLRGIHAELERTLLLGGIFISAHPIGSHPDLLGTSLCPVRFGTSHELTFDSGRLFSGPQIRMQIKGFPELCYPASFTIRSRLHELSLLRSYAIGA